MARLPPRADRSDPTHADSLLFGGLTAVNKTAANPTGVPLLTNDVHYLQVNCPTSVQPCNIT